MNGPDLRMSSYAQYLTPLIVLQAISFASSRPLSARRPTRCRASTDASNPCRSVLTPLAARMTASVYRCVIGLTVASACGFVIDRFRFYISGRSGGQDLHGWRASQRLSKILVSCINNGLMAVS